MPAMGRSTSWIAIVALAAASGCKKKAARPPIDAAVPVDAAAAPPAPPPARSKLDDAARVKGDIHAPPVDDGQPKKPPRDATGIEKRR